MRTLEQVREAMELSKTDIARLCEATTASVYAWEMGKSKPRPKHYPKIARAYGLTVEELEEVLNTQPKGVPMRQRGRNSDQEEPQKAPVRAVLWEDQEWNFAQDRIRN